MASSAMAMDDDDDEIPQQSKGVLDSVINPTTTPEAQKYARQILERGNTTQKPEDDIVSQMQNNADVARQVLQQARSRLLSQQYDPTNSRAWLTAGAALSAPTHSGNISESLGNLAKAMNQEQSQKQGFSQQQGAEDTDLGLKLSGIDSNVLAAKLGLAKLHEQGETGLQKEALSTLGKTTKPPAGETSQFEDLLRAQGITEGTSQWNAQLKALMDKKTHIAVPPGQQEYTPKPGDYQLADSIARYDAPYPGGMGSNNPRAMWLKDTLADQGRYPNYSADMYPVIQAGRKSALVGQDKQDIEALNASIQHMGLLKSLVPAMRQNDWHGVNAILNTAGIQTGGANITNAQAVAQVLGPEIEKAIQRNGGTGTERLDKVNLLLNPKATQSPDQINGALDEVKGLFAGKVNAKSRALIGDPVTGGGGSTHWKPEQFNTLLSPDTQVAVWQGAHPGVTDDDLAILKAHPEKREQFLKHYNLTEAPPGYAEGGSVDSDDPFKGKIETPKAAAATGDDDPFGKTAVAPGGSPTAMKVAKALEQGATLKFGDELNSAVEPGDYSQNLTHERGDVSEFEHEHPMGAEGLEIAGGAGTTAAALAGLRALHGSGKTGAVERLLTLASRYAPEGPMFGPKAAARNYIRPLTIGAAAGATAGAGGNTNPDELGSDMLEQGGAGAVLGPAGQLAGRLGTRLGGNILDRIMGRNLSPGTRAVTGSLGDDPQTALAALQQRLTTDRAAGVPSTIGDAATGDTRALAQAAMRQPSPEGAAYDTELQARQAGAPSRVSDIVNKGLKPDAYEAKQSELTDQLYQNAKPLYDDAYSQFPRVKSDELFSLMSTPSGKKAAKTAFRMMQDEQVPIGDADVQGMVRRPSLQYLDYVKRALDDQIQTEEGTGPNYAPTQQGKVLRGMRQRFVDELDEATTMPNGDSPYVAARGQYKGDMEVRDALRSGLTDFNAMTPDQLQSHIGDMGPSEKDAFRSGVAESFFQKLRESKGTTNPAQLLVGERGIKDKMGMLFDNPAQSRQFITGLQREMELYASSKGLTGAAASGRNAAANADLSDNPVTSTIDTLARPGGGVGPAAGSLVRRLLPEPKAPGQIADIMSAHAGPEANSELAQLRQAVAQIKARNANIGTMGTVGAGALGPNAPTQLTQ